MGNPCLMYSPEVVPSVLQKRVQALEAELELLLQ